MYNGSGADPVGVDQASTHITDLPQGISKALEVMTKFLNRTLVESKWRANAHLH